MIIEESKDLSSLALDELIGNLKVHKVIMERDSEICKGKRKMVKSIALKANRESSDDETSTSESDHEEYAMAVRDFKKFFRRNDRCFRQPREKKKSFWKRDDKKGKSDRKCFRCGDPNHLIVKDYRSVGVKINSNNCSNAKIRLVLKRELDKREYNLPTTNEVAVTVFGKLDVTSDKRAIIVQEQKGKYKRNNEMHPLYLPLQYPLLFPYSKDGYRDDIFLHRLMVETDEGRYRIPIREWFAYLLQQRVTRISLKLMRIRLF
ncbi:hypothetical protein Tco_1438584 [Tanacetum coccineum]